MDNNSPTDNAFEKACKHKALDAALTLKAYGESDVLKKAEQIYQWLIKFDDAPVKQE